MFLEVEVKFYVPDLSSLREKLLAAGATLKKPRVFERNIRFDNGWDGLRRKGDILRLRQDAKTKITWKGNPPESLQTEAKVREEIEIEVSDFDKAQAMLLRLGFEQRQVYEKYRETLQLGQVEIVLDEMPYGNFVELEGPEALIRLQSANLGLSWDKRIVTNYLGLFGMLQEHHALPFNDLTFENFVGLNASIADILD